MQGLPSSQGLSEHPFATNCLLFVTILLYSLMISSDGNVLHQLHTPESAVSRRVSSNIFGWSFKPAVFSRMLVVQGLHLTQHLMKFLRKDIAGPICQWIDQCFGAGDVLMRVL